MIRIIKFHGMNTHKFVRDKYVGVVIVIKDEQEKKIRLPVYAHTASSAASLSRKWRKIPGNIERLEAAFDSNMDAVPFLKSATNTPAR